MKSHHPRILAGLPVVKINWGILFLAAGFSASAYTLPALPPMPAIPAPGMTNSVPMGDPANFPETNMDFAIETNGPFAPTWTSIAANVPGNGAPAWLRQAKFGSWVHYGPQSEGASGDWFAQHMYQPGSAAYTNHLAQFGHPSTNGYKDVINAWNPTNYNPAALAQLYYNAGARFALVQGVHHDNFDNWNSTYNSWNEMNFGPRRDTLVEWANATHALGMHYGVAFHHEYSWWFYVTAYGSDNSGALAGVPYDAVSVTNGTGTWWQNYDLRRLYNINLSEYQGIETTNLSGGWAPAQGIFTNHLDYAHWYATQWALRILDVIENYDPDFIYTDGDSTQPFSGSRSGTGYKCDAMERIIAHYYNRTLERHGQLDTFAVVKFHSGGKVGTTSEGSYPSNIKTDQPWFGEMTIGDWFWYPGISYDSGGAIVQRLLECVSRDGALAVNIPNRPDGALDSGATNMIAGVAQWMATNSEGIYGSHAWLKFGEGSFRFIVGSNGCLYAYYLGVPAAGTRLTIASLGTSSNLLAAPIQTVSLLGGTGSLVWSQTVAGLNITCPSSMPALPAGTAIGFKIGSAQSIGSTPPTDVLALPQTNGINLSWNYPSAVARFNVKRSTTYGGPYTSISTSLTNTAYFDTNVTTGTLYFYVITATDVGGESANSAQVMATPAGLTLSSPWSQVDVGPVNAAGTGGNNGGSFLIQGSGADMWNATDAFHFVFFSLTNNGSITARVLYVQNVNLNAKAGVMIRNTLDTGSMSAMAYCAPNSTVRFNYRATTGGNAAESSTTVAGLPYWVRLTRTGNSITAARSSDGANWTTVGSPVAIVMNSNVLVGLAVNSHTNGILCQAWFDNISWTPATPPDAPTWVSATAGDSQAILAWNTSADVTGYNLKRSITNGGSYTTIATNTPAISFTDTNLANGVTYYYVVSATNSAGESANSSPISVRPVFTAPLTFNCGISGNQLQLSWPADHAGWKLQVQTNPLNTGLGTNWVTMPNSNLTNQFSASIGATNGSVFFRLVSP